MTSKWFGRMSALKPLVWGVVTLWSVRHMSSLGFFISRIISSSSLRSSIFLSLLSRFSSLFSCLRRSRSCGGQKRHFTNPPDWRRGINTTQASRAFTSHYYVLQEHFGGFLCVEWAAFRVLYLNDLFWDIRRVKKPWDAVGRTVFISFFLSFVSLTSAFFRASTAFISITCCLLLSLSWKDKTIPSFSSGQHATHQTKYKSQRRAIKLISVV